MHVSRTELAPWCLAVCLAISRPATASAGPAEGLEDFRTAAAPLAPLEGRDRNLEKLAAELGHPIRSVTHSNGLTALTGTLGPLGPASDRAPEEIARRFLAKHARAVGLPGPVLSTLVLEHAYTTAHNGAHHLTFHQVLEGLPVLDGVLRVHLSAAGEVVSVQPAELARALRASGSFATTALDAAELAAAEIAEPWSRADLTATGESLTDGGVRFAVPGRPQPIEVRRALRADGSAAHPAWEVLLPSRTSPDIYRTVVDGRTGVVRSRQTTTQRVATEGCVHPHNGFDPVSAVPYPDDTVLVIPESPAGWVTDDTTAGNNVLALEDMAGDDETTPGYSPTATGAPLSFCFTDELDTLINQGFYFVNLAHDEAYRLGFDEPAGNMQLDNFGKGGEANDRLILDVWDGKDRGAANNANISTAPDGLPPRMQVMESTIINEMILDGDVILHEYQHAISNRLIGGPDTYVSMTGLQGRGLTEGTADFFPATVFNNPCILEWTTGMPGQGRYCLDQVTATFGDICHGCEEEARQVWSGTLWSLRETLIGALGAAAGTETTGLLFMDTLKLTPLYPTFLDMRDALLVADRLGFGGANRCAIWEAAAARGLGVSATTTGPDDDSPAEAFDLPAECAGVGLVMFERESYGCGGSLSLTVVDANAPPAITVAVTTANGDDETVSLDCIAPLSCSAVAPLPILSVAGPADVVPFNGTLEVIEGESVTATYDDDDPIANATATTRIRCVAMVELTGYQIEGDCDQDAVPGYPELTGFLDAGERAQLYARIANDESFDLDGVELTITVDNPKVMITSPVVISVGTLAAKRGEIRADHLEVIDLEALDTVTSGEVAVVTLALTADGYRGTTGPVSVELPLNHDYILELGQPIFADDFEGAQALTWSHDSLEGPDEWQLADCTASSPSRAYDVGSAGCAEAYTAQFSYLASPSFWPPGGPDIASFRVTDVRFDHDLDGSSQPLVAVEIAATGTIDGASTVIWSSDDQTSGFETVDVAVNRARVDRLPTADGQQVAFWFCDHPGDPASGRGWSVDDVVVLGDIVRIVDDPGCASTRGPWILQMWRAGVDLELRWSAEPAPDTLFNIHRTTAKERLVATDLGIGAEPIVASPDIVTAHTVADGVAGGSIEYFAVYERDPSTGATVFD